MPDLSVQTPLDSDVLPCRHRPKVAYKHTLLLLSAGGRNVGLVIEAVALAAGSVGGVRGPPRLVVPVKRNAPPADHRSPLGKEDAANDLTAVLWVVRTAVLCR